MDKSVDDIKNLCIAKKNMKKNTVLCMEVTEKSLINGKGLKSI
jgi:hypothetical protein